MNMNQSKDNYRYISLHDMIFFIHEKDIYFAFRKLCGAKAECKNFF